ncbi:MAG: hypothetical protein FWF84_02210 [Kiritimatiellaeota bacterium]|nr:hypothetical protein [Kiritimatiellota bacterium]
MGQVRVQTVTLEKGWNAVWLEVQPEDATPEEVFAGADVDMVAGYVKPVSAAQFAKNNAVNVQSLSGWSVWYAPHRADASLSRLFKLGADAGYLVHALEAAEVTVRGTVSGRAYAWTPNRFNLAGFTVASQGAPTFGQFFQSSSAHSHDKVYRLHNGAWRQVTNPATEVMRPGEAFWIYCDGASAFQGPLSVKANTPAGLALSGTKVGDVAFVNVARHPVAFTLSLVAGEGNDTPPMAAVVRSIVPEAEAVTDMPIDFADGAWTQELPVLEAGEAFAIPFVLRVTAMEKGSQSGLLKITTDLGTETWVPVRTEYQ